MGDRQQFSEGQGWSGKTQPGLTHPVKTGLNHTEKPIKVGKIGFYWLFSKIFQLKPNFLQKIVKNTNQKISKLISNWEYLVKQNPNCPLNAKLSSEFPDLVLQFSIYIGNLIFPQFNPKNPLKPGINQLNPLGWVFDEKPGFLHNPDRIGPKLLTKIHMRAC